MTTLNTRPITEAVVTSKVGFVGPIVQTGTHEWGFMLLQNKTTIKLTYPSQKEASKARVQLSANKNLYMASSDKLFKAIMEAIMGE